MIYSEKNILPLSLPLAALVIIGSSLSLLTPGFYSQESLNWAAQSAGQDIIDLFLIVPVLLTTAIFTTKKNKTALLLWAGVNLYIAYTFVIYCFDLHFNKLFPIYCFSLGLSVYSFLYFLLTHIKEPAADWFESKTPFRYLGIYFLLIAIFFYLLWLADIIPAMVTNTSPKSLTESRLFTNPVEIIDLSVFLPGTFIIGILLLKGKAFGFLMAPVLLAFFVLMDITIGGLIVVMKMRGQAVDYSLTIIMSMLAIFSAVLLIIYLANMKSNKKPYYHYQ